MLSNHCTMYFIVLSQTPSSCVQSLGYLEGLGSFFPSLVLVDGWFRSSVLVDEPRFEFGDYSI